MQLRGTDTQAPRSATTRQDSDNGGWLSDLLLRASRDDDDAPSAKVEPAPAAPKPQPRAEALRDNSGGSRNSGATALDSLNAISVDIARMVEHSAVVTAWDRFNRGENGVFDRNIYTAQGRETFEEIRRKYGRDAEFRQTVDRYVEEFERLLREVARDDRDQILTRTYLVSETGKVYTMLAHASGRLG